MSKSGETESNPEYQKIAQQQEEESGQTQKSDQPKKIPNMWTLGITYMAAMGVCGTVLVAIGSNLEDMAENCGTTSTEIGTVFIARGVGAIFGAILSAKLYLWYHGSVVMSFALAAITLLLLILPYNTSVIFLHAIFFFLGLATAITDTGCQIMTRKIHGKGAGPWLGANTVAFGIAGAIVPLIEVFTDSMIVEYSILSGIVLLVTFMLIFGPNPEKDGRLSGMPTGKGKGGDAPHYNVEIVIACMVFCFIGGKVSMTAYLKTYVDDTGVLSTGDASYLILVFWIAITIGRLAGVQDQRFVTNETLPLHLTILCIGGFLSMLLILWFPDSADCLWIGIAFYGLFNGPCVGYSYDWNNRTTYPTEKSMSIVMFGLNFGASLVPYLTAVIWNHGGGPMTLIVVTFLSMFTPLPLLYITKYLSYDPVINPYMKTSYAELPQDEQPI
jgi:predicted MFS family arabinose efflux permease